VTDDLIVELIAEIRALREAIERSRKRATPRSKPQRATPEKLERAVDAIVGKVDSQGINWQRWAYSVLREATQDALARGADYIGLHCPRCQRVRLQPSAQAGSDLVVGSGSRSLKCEKCGWSARLTR